MELLDNQQSDKGCPNLNPKSILAHSDKGLDLEVLCQGLKEDRANPLKTGPGLKGIPWPRRKPNRGGTSHRHEKAL